MPQRAKGTSPDFPILGTGKYDWKGFKPATQTANYLPFTKHPQAVDPPYLVSWNNKQAPGMGGGRRPVRLRPDVPLAADRRPGQGGIKGGRKMTIAQLVQAMEEPATEDLRGDGCCRPCSTRSASRSRPRLQEALATLSAWHEAGAHRRDLDRDGVDEETPAIELMDAWWPNLVSAEFKPALGKRRSNDSQGMLKIGDHTGGSPDAPDFFDGWWGYVSKDLRDLFGPKPKGRYSRVYCGGGSKSKCRDVLQKTLAKRSR